MQKVLKKVYKAEEATEEELLDGVMALGKAHMWMDDRECKACYNKAMEGFVRLLGEDSAKAVGAAYRLIRGPPDEKIAEYRHL